MDAVTQIETRLLGVMASWPLPIEPNCEQELRQAIRNAARRVVQEGHRPDSAKVNEAEYNLKKLLVEMTRVAGAQGFTSLHEPTFYEAKKQICPLWPFC